MATSAPDVHEVPSMKAVVAPTIAALVLAAASVVALTPPPAVADANARPGTVAEKPRAGGVHAVDGEVRTVAQVGGSVVLGGSFTKVGPATAGAVGVVDTGARTFQPGFPEVVGSVSAAVPDGAGGWYLGGSFTSVGSVPRTNLAHVDGTGTVTAFNPAPNGAVLDLATTATNGLVVAGSFTTIAGGPGAGVAAFTGTETLRWAGSVTGGAVRTIALSNDGALVYAGGDFAQVGGVAMRRFGALNADTGTLNTAFAPGVVNLPVNDIVVRSTGDVLLAGEFTKVGGAVRNRLAQVNGVTGAVGTLNVSVNNTVNDVEVDAAAGVAYLAGSLGQ